MWGGGGGGGGLKPPQPLPLRGPCYEPPEFFPPKCILLCEATGIVPPCQSEEEECKIKVKFFGYDGLNKLQVGSTYYKGIINEVQTRFTFLKK